MSFEDLNEGQKEIAPIYLEIKNYEEPLKIDKFKLRKITQYEREIIFGIKDIKKQGKGYAIYETENKYSLINSMYNIEYHHMQFANFVIEYEGDDKNYLLMNIRDLLLSFNLYEEGLIDAPYRIGRNGVCYDMQKISSGGKKYVIDSNEIIEVEKIFKLILDNQNEKLKLLLERFRNTHFANLREENIFVELMSIVESLLNLGNAELSFRLSLFVSYLLNNKCNYKASFKKIKNFYNTRSKLIHNGMLKNGLDKEDLIDLRRCTAKLLVLALYDFDQIKNVEKEIKEILSI